MRNKFEEKIRAVNGYSTFKECFNELHKQGDTREAAFDRIIKAKELDSTFSPAKKIELLGALLQSSLEKIETPGEKSFMLEILSRFGTAIKAHSLTPNIQKKAAALFDEVADKLKKYFDPQIIELERIVEGVYQEQYYAFTYYGLLGPVPKAKGETFEHQEKTIRSKVDGGDYAGFKVYPVMDQPGIRCTGALPAEMNSSGPIELQLNFFGTIDWASKAADVDCGGPGQETLKEHEQTLLKNLNDMIEHLSERYPNRPINLRINGHSLGGSLAKGFAHSIQRALAVQNKKPEEVVNEIAERLAQKEKEQQIGAVGQIKTDASSYKNPETLKDLQSLKQQLEQDKRNFTGMKGLKALNKLTVYAMGSPGVSKTTDDHATLLTYSHDSNFLSIYNHFHEEDLITKFGESEFLSGRKIIPNIAVNKNVVFKVELSEQEIVHQETLPFPGITKKVMAVHNKMIAEHNSAFPNNRVQTAVSDIHSAESLSREKFYFNPIRIFLLTAVIKLIAAIVSLFTTSKELNPIEHFKKYKAVEDGAESNTSDFIQRYKAIVQEHRLPQKMEDAPKKSL